MAATPQPDTKTWRWNERFPEMGQEPIPVERVISPEYFALEREKVFKRSWLHVGRVEQIPDAGDYFVQDIEAAKTSLLVTRGKDGEIRAFHNVCAHRGNRLVCDRAGSGNGSFACRFHGWIYDTRGELVHVTQEENFYGETRGHLDLSAVACDVWEGFIFVHLDPERAEPLAEFLGPIADYVSGFPFETITHELRYETALEANWKVVRDSQAESLHAPFVHKQVWPDLFSSREHPNSNYLDLTFYDRHAVWSLGAGKYQPKGVEAYALSLGPATAMAGEFAVEIGGRINPTRSTDWALDCLHVYPNLLIYILEGTYHTHQFWPSAANRTVWDLRMRLPAVRTPADAFSREHAKIFLRDPFLEDGFINEETQKGLESGAISHVQFQDDESFLRHAYWVVHNAVSAE